MGASRLLKAPGDPGISAHHTHKHKQALLHRGMSLKALSLGLREQPHALLTEHFYSCLSILCVKEACSYRPVSLVQSVSVA